MKSNRLIRLALSSAIFVALSPEVWAGVAGQDAVAPAGQATVEAGQQATTSKATAQSQKPQPPKSSSKVSKKKSVTTLASVTVVAQIGTNIAGVVPTGTEAINLDRATILKTGATDVNTLLQTLPQVSNQAPSGLGNQREGGSAGYGSTNGGANPTQGTAINLRGLGPQATLVLIDGHRVTPTGTAVQFTDINQVPAAALESVQVMNQGGSAIYGSDAVAGVVNLGIRKDFSGLEVTPRATWASGYDSKGVSVIAGHTWSQLFGLGQGNLMVTLDYTHRSAMLGSESPYLSDDLTGFGGANNEIRGSGIGGGSITTGAINGGVGPGQPGAAGSKSGGSGPVANPGATSNVAWCDNFVAGSCHSGKYLYRGLPAGTIATDYSQTSAQPSLADRADSTDFLGRQKQYQLDTFFNQDINDNLRIDFMGFLTYRNTASAGSPYSGNTAPMVTVNPGTPYYISPLAPAGGPMTVSMSPTALGIPGFNTHNTVANWTTILGAHAKLWADWRADLSMTFGRDRSCGECQPLQVDGGALQYAVNTGAINPLSTTLLTPAQLAMFLGRNIQINNTTFQDDVLKFDGTVLDLPGGPLKMAIGTEFMRQTQHIANGANRTDEPQFGIAESSALPPLGYEGIGCSAPLPCPPRTQPNEFAYDNIGTTSRDVNSAFLEFNVPVVSKGQNIPFMRSLAFDVAGRFDNYSGIGNTTNPKISFTWELNDDLSVQGSWGRSFVAPSLPQSNPFVYSLKSSIGNFPNLTGDPSLSGPIPGMANVGFLFGNQSNLQPQTAKTWALGATFTPSAVPRLRITSTYYHISYDDIILGVSAFPAALLSPSGLATYRPFVHPVHNPSDCSATNPNYDPALTPFINAVGIYGIVSPDQLCRMTVFLDDRNTNAGSMVENGADFNAQYRFTTNGNSTWLFDINATKVMSQELALTPSTPAMSILGSLRNGGLVPWRGRVSASWMKGPIVATLFGNYVGHYTNDNPLFGRQNSPIPSWTTFDANLTVDLGELSVPNWLAGSSVSLHVNNLTDRDPPVVLTSGGGAFDANNASLFGRVVELQFTYGIF